MQLNQLFKSGPLCATLLALGLLNTQAQTTATWTGPVSGGEWSTGANWDLGVPGVATNAVILGGAAVNYNTPMAAASIANLYLGGAAALNLNAAGFNLDSGLISSSVTVGVTGSSGTLNLNSGGSLTVSNAGPLYISTNGLVTVNAGSTLLVTNALATDGLLVGDNKRLATGQRAQLKMEGGTATINGRLTIAGSPSATSGGSEVAVNGGVMNLLGGSRINNTTDDGACRFLINGGSVALGNFSVYKSSPNPGAGLVISNGVVNATGIQIGIGNSRSFGAIYGGVLTNTGVFTVSDTTIAATSGERRSRFLVLGGTVVSSTPEGIIVGNQANGGAASASIFGGILDISGGTVFANGITLVKDNTLANAYGTFNLSGSGTVYLGSVGLVGNAGAGGSGHFVNFNGGTLGASADFPITATVKLSGTTTIKTANALGNPFNITVSGSLTNTGSINKTGGGVLKLDAANTYSGSTWINGGTLALGASGTLASPLVVVGQGTTLDVSAIGSSYTFNAGQTLGGSGVVTGAVALASTATLNPGSNQLTGTLTFANDLIETGGAVNFFDLPASPSGSGNDAVVVGNLTVSGVNTIQINGGAASGAYKLFQYGAFTGDLSNFSLSGSTGSLSNSIANKAIYLVIATTIRTPTNVVWVGNSLTNTWDSLNLTNWLNNGVLDYFISGDQARFDSAGAANASVNIPGSVLPGSVTVDAATDYVFAGTGGISGFGSLTKTNSGRLTIQTTNQFTGGVSIKGGTLSVESLADDGADSPIGKTGPILIDGGTLEYAGLDYTWTRTVSLGTNGLAGISVSNAATVFTYAGILDGPGALTKSGDGTLVLNNVNTHSGGTILNTGTLTLNNASGAGPGTITLNGGNLALGAVKPANILNVAGPSMITGGNAGGLTGIKNVTGSSNVLVAVSGGTTFDLTGDMTAYSGTITLSNAGGSFVRLFGSTGSALAIWDLGSTTIDLFVRSGSTLNHFGALQGGTGTTLSGRGGSSNNGPTTHEIGALGLNSTFDGIIQNGSGGSSSTTSITKVGTGTLTLSGANTYTGSTTVSNGTIALFTSGSIAGSTNINITSGTAIDVAGRSDGTLALGSSQTLRGNGLIRGSLDSTGGGLVAPGAADGQIGQLTITNLATLGGTVVMELNRTNPGLTNDVLMAATSLLGGTLTVTNVGPMLAVGDRFVLFRGPVSGTFAAVNLPGAATEATYTWQDDTAVDGSIRVLTVVPVVNQNPTNMTAVVTNGTLVLSWPTDHTGWSLQVQTNSLANGLGDNWVTIPDSNLSNSYTNLINPTNGSVFYRMVYP